MKSSHHEGVALKVLLAGLAVAAVGSFGFYAKALLLKYPPVWPDESLFANPAIGLMRTGVMGTSLLSGLLPGIEQHTYWMPPLYYVYVWAVFFLWGPGVIQMRLASLAAALGVMVLTYFVGKKSGLGRWLSLIPVSILAVDVVFLRAALIGRMDMLALAFILSTLWLATGPTSPEEFPTRERSFLTGVASGAAALTHPMGFVAPVTVLTVRALFRNGPWRRTLAFTMAGISLPMLGWAAYILQEPGSFVSQFGRQLVRKSSRDPLALNSLLSNLWWNLSQYGISEEVVGLVWVSGLIGLYVAAFKRNELWVLPGCQVMTLALVLWSREMWYPIYLVPLTCIGLGHLSAMAQRTGFRRAIPAFLTLILSIWFARGNLNRASDLNHVQNKLFGDVTNYTDWCGKISEKIPRGSRVTLSVIPDPYLGLVNRRDLTLREFIPEGFPADEELYRRAMEDSDFIVLGRESPSKAIGEFVNERGTLVQEVGSPFYPSYYARIYRIAKSQAGQTDHELPQ